MVFRMVGGSSHSIETHAAQLMSMQGRLSSRSWMCSVRFSGYWWCCVDGITLCVRRWKVTFKYSIDWLLHSFSTCLARCRSMLTNQPINWGHHASPQSWSYCTPAQPTLLYSGIRENAMWPARCKYLKTRFLRIHWCKSALGSIPPISFLPILNRTRHVLTDSL